MKAVLADPDPVAYLWTHVQSGDLEVSWEDDLHSEFPDSEFWHRTPLYKALKTDKGLLLPPQGQQGPQDHITQRFNQVV